MALKPITEKEVQNFIDKVAAAAAPEVALEGIPLLAQLLLEIRRVLAHRGTAVEWDED